MCVTRGGGRDKALPSSMLCFSDQVLPPENSYRLNGVNLLKNEVWTVLEEEKRMKSYQCLVSEFVKELR